MKPTKKKDSDMTKEFEGSTAIIEKETEKAYQLSFVVDLYGEDFSIKKVWMPKSQIEAIRTFINDFGHKVLVFQPKNDWILNAKTRDYCKYVASMFENIKHEVKTYLSGINNVTVTWCHA